MPVMVVDGHITCPECKCIVTVIQNKSIGASYAKKWEKLHPIHTQFLTWWVSTPSRRYETYTKTELLELFKQETGINVTDDSFNARISELLSAGTEFGQPLLTRSRNVKDSIHHTSKAPVYQLNIKRVMDVIYDGGRML
jgi:hypothetical protein